MACRFVDTEVWEEDWFIELGMEYQHFWRYITDNCNHAGIWKPNKSGFEMRTRAKVNLDLFLKKVNGDKERILRLRDGNWFLTGFIKFQWFNKKESFDLVLSNRLHQSIYSELQKHNVPHEKIRGLKEVLQTSKDKEMEKVKDLGKELVFGEKKECSIAVKKVYLNDQVKRIYDLQKYFDYTGQLNDLQVAGMNRFDDFILANPGNVFNDGNHLYNTFRKYCNEQRQSINGKVHVSLEELRRHGDV